MAWTYSIHSWVGDKGSHTFPSGSNLKLNVIERLEIEFANSDVAVPLDITPSELSFYIYIYIYVCVCVYVCMCDHQINIYIYIYIYIYILFSPMNKCLL